MEPPDEIRDYLLKLGRMIERILSESKEVGEILRRIQEKGYHVHLGFVTMVSPKEKKEKLTFELTEWDRKFLRSIGIDFNEDDGGCGN